MKKAQVIWSAEALVDLEVIYDFLAGNSQSAAQRIILNILATAKQLENFPESGARHEAIAKEGRQYRYLVEGNYKIIYTFKQERGMVYIEIIFDTRNNPDK